MFSQNRIHDIKAIVILGLLIFASYLPITVLGHTANTSLNLTRMPVLDFERDYGCTHDCIGPFNFTIDPGADGDAIWPVAKLAANLYSQGILPLWNPYLAAGTPLAADTINFAFSPMMIFHLLPDSLWDIQLLISIWLAGIFTYFLLKSWQLGFLSSISGSIIFMLSGAITWYLPHDSVLVILFTPLILFSIEKVFQSKNFKYVILGSVAIAFAVLGGHLESISLVLLVCGAYSLFKILYVVLSKRNNVQVNPNDLQTNGLVIAQNKKRTIFKILLIFFAGLGLSAFFIIPVSEYVVNGTIGRDVIAGIAYSPAFTIATTFIPYFLGPIHVYAIPATSFVGSWNVLGGYVIASSLVFSLLGITFSNQLFQSSLHKRTAQFFFAISIFFMLKSIGVPIINSLGYLPILDHVVFPRYDGFIYTLGLAISAAFGIEVIIQRKMRMKHLGALTIVSFLIVISMALLIIPYFAWIGLPSYYVIFQVLQALFFILVAFLSIVAYQRNNHNASAMFFIFFLEASLYIPFGLPPIWQFYRSITVILGIIALCTMSFLPIEKKIVSINRQNTKLVIFVIITGFTIGGQLVVYLESPQGLLLRHDAFSSTPITDFLKSKIDDYRIFSFDSIFRPDYPAAYQIQTLGILSAQNVNFFNSFFHNILDPYAMVTHFDYIPSWRVQNAPSVESTFLQNQKYYNFLGVKYIVATQTNPNELQTDVRGKTEFVPVGSSKESIKQTFVSPTDRIGGIKIFFGTYNKINHGNLTLTLDSIPYDVNSHRISAINLETVKDGGFSQFEFAPVIDAKGKSFSLALSDPQANENNEIAALVHGTDVDNKTLSSDLLNGQFYINGNSSKGRLTFSLLISQEKFPLVFNHDGVNIYENKDTYPRAFLVNKFQTADSYQNAQNIIQDPDFDLRHEIVLEKNPPIEQANLLNSSNLNDSTTKIVSYTANKVTINVNATGDSLLVLTDTYYPGWQAHIDGKESNIYRADGLVRAVFVPDGSHTIEFSYMPKSFVIGIIISTVVALSFLILYVYSKKSRTNFANYTD